ncbi:MAG TPA: DUF6789 family protein [Roseiflexaceae bacterium]|nr:DUF6789 family protein [Roseiflexaceae bacterium]
MSTTSPFVRNEASPLPDVVGLGGAIAGLIGGLSMALVGAIISASIGGDIWLESKQIAAIVYGSAAAAQPGFEAGPVLVGTLLHLLISTVLGALFGIVTRRIFHLTSEFGTLLMAGLIYGMLIWLVGYFAVLPAINPLLRETYAPAFIVQHLVYGAVTGLVYTMLRPQPYDTPR